MVRNVRFEPLVNLGPVLRRADQTTSDTALDLVAVDGRLADVNLVIRRTPDLAIIAAVAIRGHVDHQLLTQVF